MLKLPQPRASLKFIIDKDEFNKQPTTHDPYPSSPNYSRIGPNSEIHTVEFCTDHASNWKRGVIKRDAHAHQQDNATSWEFFHFVADNIIPFIDMLPAGLSFWTLFDDWIDNSKYTLKRKNHLRECAEMFLAGQIDPKHILVCKSFIKKEFYDQFKEPRIINSRSDTFKAIVGPYIHAIEKLIYDEHYIKHLKPDEIATKMNTMSQEHQFVYETDYSSFEGSFSTFTQTHVELALFKHCLHNYPSIVSLIEKCYTNPNILVYKRFMKCKFFGSRMSGDMWTSLANGFTNNCLVQFFAHKARQQNGCFRYDYIVEGDDGFICTDFPLKFELAAPLGFQLKCEQKFDKNDVSFCGICEFQGTLVPDIKRILNHYGYAHSVSIVSATLRKTKRARKVLKDMLHSKALSLLAQSKGIPVLQSIAQQQLKLGGHFNPRYVDWWENEVYDFTDLSSLKAMPITDEMRSFVAKRFEIPVQMQIEIEEELRTCKDACYDIDLFTMPASKDVHFTRSSRNHEFSIL